jgi:RNA polymerase sigma factor (sigma-70 family)
MAGLRAVSARPARRDVAEDAEARRRTPEPSARAGAEEVVVQSDEMLIAAVAGGDEGALRALYERHAAVMLRLLRRLTADQSEAEDVLQEAWMSVWSSARTFRGDSSVRGWLLGVTRRTCHDKLRRKRLARADLSEAADISDTQPGVEAQVLAAAGLARIQEAIARLPEPLRDVVVLGLGEELPYRDVAAAVGVPVGTVKSRMSLARRRLVQELTGELASQEGAW